MNPVLKGLKGYSGYIKLSPFHSIGDNYQIGGGSTTGTPPITRMGTTYPLQPPLNDPSGWKALHMAPPFIFMRVLEIAKYNTQLSLEFP